MPRRTLAGLSLVAVVALAGTSLVVGQAQAPGGSSGSVRMPTFEVDPTWPKLPNNWVIGDPSSIAVDRRDHVWILHRPRTVPAEKKERAAPPVLEFDNAGKFVRAWEDRRTSTSGRTPSTASMSTTRIACGLAATIRMLRSG